MQRRKKFSNEISANCNSTRVAVGSGQSSEALACFKACLFGTSAWCSVIYILVWHCYGILRVKGSSIMGTYSEEFAPGEKQILAGIQFNN